jgi:hypothetical protein
MKAVVLKKDKRFESRNDKTYGIQTYGENNDYPQQVRMIVKSSGTGTSCLNIYKKFIKGKGFTKETYSKILNESGQSTDYILEMIANDFAEFGGVAIHVNYNANFKIVEINHVPFEHVRFDLPNEKGEFDKVKIHTDWGRQFTKIRKWKKDDIETLYLFNPDPAVIAEQVELSGGWENYKGQVYYYSSSGVLVYPEPIYDSVLTDMNTEEGISNVNNRNVRNNFLTAGMLIDKVQDNNSLAGDEMAKSDEQSDTEKAILQFQGDENAGKILYIQIETEDEKPEFVSFKGENYDKEFAVTNETVEDKIGQAFNQPPILRAKDVGANFGADLIKNAYNFYNSVTENERIVLERIFNELFRYWFVVEQFDFTIDPLSYDVETTLAERIGTEGMNQVVNILNSSALTKDEKKSSIKTLFGLTEIETLSIL